MPAANVILDVLYRYGSEDGSLPLTEIVIAAWRAAPERFGLKGFTDTHPDSHRVVAAVVQLDRRDKLVERCGVRRYRLTERGKGRVQA